MTRSAKPRGGNYCQWGCGREKTPGRSRKTRREFTTCGPCRYRYAFNKRIRRLCAGTELKDQARALHAKLRLEAIAEELLQDPDRYAWHPDDDETDTLEEKDS